MSAFWFGRVTGQIWLTLDYVIVRWPFQIAMTEFHSLLTLFMTASGYLSELEEVGTCQSSCNFCDYIYMLAPPCVQTLRHRKSGRKIKQHSRALSVHHQSPVVVRNTAVGCCIVQSFSSKYVCVFEGAPLTSTQASNICKGAASFQTSWWPVEWLVLSFWNSSSS